MIRNLVQTLAAGVGLAVVVVVMAFAAGAVVGTFLSGICAVAAVRACL